MQLHVRPELDTRHTDGHIGTGAGHGHPMYGEYWVAGQGLNQTGFDALIHPV